jgi:c-di-GMP-binding flagellar brake protein YcgR
MTLWPVVSIEFDILFRNMPSDAPTSQPSAKERRAYFRINAILPISIQAETDTTEGALIEKSVNISGGGIGVTVNVVYNPGEILALTLILPDQVIFKAYAEVLWLDPIPHHVDTYRLHARFVRMTTQNQELLIRHILRFQRDHLEKHYSA